MSKKELLYKQLGALRLEVDSSIVDEIVATANAAFQEQLLQQTPCSTLRESWADKLIDIQQQLSLAFEDCPNGRIHHSILELNKVIAAINVP